MKKFIYSIIRLILIILILGMNMSCMTSTTSEFRGPVNADEPLPDALVSDLENYVVKLMKQYDIPGTAIVLVHGKEIVYSRGLGVKDLETRLPVTTKTLFGIGSSTKPMTAIMVASLVDEGVIDWDTPVTNILPTFAVSDPEITKKITYEHTLCMCTGVPRKIEDISVQYNELTAEEIVESLATIPLVGMFERHYAYSERMFSAGGYLSAMAAGGEYRNLAQSYAQAMQERVLDPVGMTSSTLSIPEAVASGDYATPYYSSLSGYEALSTGIEGIFSPIAPTGAMWSNAEDLGKLLIMLLNNGVSVDGQQVVSPENLEFLWEPRTTIDAAFKYGLGWNIENYHGLTVIDHPGGTVGFASELAVIPELDIGFAMLINRLDLIHPVGRMTRYRLLEILTGSEQVYDQEMRKSARDFDQQILALKLLTAKTINPAKITPFLGSYHNDVLGDVDLVLHDDRTLWVDFGEYESSIRPLRLEDNQFIFFESVFVGKTIQLIKEADGTISMRWSGDEGVYTFEAEKE